MAGGGAARTSGAIGALLVAAGIALIATTGYELWSSNTAADEAAAELRADTWSAWAEARLPDRRDGTATSTSAPRQPEAGETIGLLYIPRLRDDVWGVPVLHGVSTEQLDRGVGHFPGAAMPGGVGNFSLAGHRTSNGQPFSGIDELAPGDAVHVRTMDAWLTYVLVRDDVVGPRDTWVLDDSPVGGLPGSRVITLVTCTPRYSTKQRWVWWGVLQRSAPADDAPIGIGETLPSGG
jgi:sortase A